mmetsp:Transcript_4614/g.20969  ORF Transcript_4614/g.20969 Transcript_4614/m.20969 type:complete len:203 (+) Transcript_4614:1064-1672(+)
MRLVRSCVRVAPSKYRAEPKDILFDVLLAPVLKHLAASLLRVRHRRGPHPRLIVVHEWLELRSLGRFREEVVRRVVVAGSRSASHQLHGLLGEAALLAGEPVGLVDVRQSLHRLVAHKVPGVRDVLDELPEQTKGGLQEVLAGVVVLVRPVPHPLLAPGPSRARDAGNLRLLLGRGRLVVLHVVPARVRRDHRAEHLQTLRS